MERVYRYRCYDVHTDEYVYSTRYATMARINRIGAEAVHPSEIFLDSKYLKDGWTEKNFDPAKAKGDAN